MARGPKYAIDAGAAKRLQLRWKGIYKNVEVVLDDQLLGEPIPDAKALKAGRDFALPDGRTLHVQLQSGLFQNQGLDLRIDGRPLPGSDRDPRTQIKLAAGILYFMAGLSALLGILGISGVRFLADLGFGWPSIVAGVVLAGLGWAGAKYRSRAAFAVAAAVLLLDMVLTVATAVDAGGRMPTTGLVIRVLILFAVFRAIKAVGDAADLDKAELADNFR